MTDGPRAPSGFDNLLATFLAIGFALALLVFLIFVSLGFFFWVIVVGAGVFLFGLLHYVLWGWILRLDETRRPEKTDEEADLS